MQKHFKHLWRGKDGSIMARGGFPNMMGGGNMQQLARQAQKLQQQMAKMQEEIEAREFEASAGGGMATARVNGMRAIAPGAHTRMACTASATQDMAADSLLGIVRFLWSDSAASVAIATGKITWTGRPPPRT